MSNKRIFVICPDHDAPSGGVRRLYRHVDVLRRHEFAATLVHDRPGFRCSWFANDTPVTARSEVSFTAQDFLVVPEVLGPGLAALAPAVPKVVFNQNAYLTFRGYPEGGSAGPCPYASPEVRAVFTVSDDNLTYLKFAFPG